MAPVEFRKHIALYVGMKDWTLIRREAARRRMTINDLVRRWITPHVDELRKQDGQGAAD